MALPYVAFYAIYNMHSSIEVIYGVFLIYNHYYNVTINLCDVSNQTLGELL